MKRYKYTGTGNNGTIAWALQRVSAIVLVVVLGYHLLGKIMSKGGSELIDGQSNAIFMSILGFFVVFHAFNGLKMVSDDYVKSKGIRFFLYLVYWTLALICLKFAMGIL